MLGKGLRSWQRGSMCHGACSTFDGQNQKFIAALATVGEQIVVGLIGVTFTTNQAHHMTAARTKKRGKTF